jgi:hypothetical protein
LDEGEFIEKLEQHLSSFFKDILKAPDVEPIMISKESIIEMLQKVGEFIKHFCKVHLIIL